jgi:hypothetical protein
MTASPTSDERAHRWVKPYVDGTHHAMLGRAARAALRRVGAAMCAMGRASLRWIECDVSPKREGEEEMKRILAVLAMVVALSIPAAAHAGSAGAHHSHGQCTPGCARTGHPRG